VYELPTREHCRNIPVQYYELHWRLSDNFLAIAQCLHWRGGIRKVKKERKFAWLFSSFANIASTQDSSAQLPVVKDEADGGQQEINLR
jgi:hypothetical protein